MTGRSGSTAASVRDGLGRLRRSCGPVEALSVAAVAVAVAVAVEPLAPPRGTAAAVATGGLLAVLVVALLAAVLTGDRRRALLAVVVAALDVVVVVLVAGAEWLSLAALVAGTAVFLAPRRAAVAVAVAVLGLTVAEVFLAAPAQMARVLLRVAVVVSQVGGAGTMVRQARAGRSLRQRYRGVLEANRRVRAAHELYEALAQNLAAVSLRSELAARLACRDPGEAAREMNDVGAIARSSMVELGPLAAERRERLLEEELAAAAELLRSAGIRTVVGPAPEGLGAGARTLLGRVVEEVTGLVLAADGATVCSITFRETDGSLVVIVRHDGRPAGSDGDGDGLDGLAQSLAAAGGRLDRERDPGGRGTRITARLPRAAELPQS